MRVNAVSGIGVPALHGLCQEARGDRKRRIASGLCIGRHIRFAKGNDGKVCRFGKEVCSVHGLRREGRGLRNFWCVLTFLCRRRDIGHTAMGRWAECEVQAAEARSPVRPQAPVKRGGSGAGTNGMSLAKEEPDPHVLRDPMKDFPSLLLLANRGRLVAYRPNGTGHLKVLDSLEPMEGNAKLSDLVTDQAGAFPTDGPGTAAYESMPLTEELKIRALRQIADKMDEILEREGASSWGFAAAPELNGAVLEQLPEERRDGLTLNLRLDLTNSPPDQVHARFDEERKHNGPPR